MSITLSKSALDRFRACPRCFWLEKNQGLKTPAGIRSGLPMGMDRVLKEHYDRHRAAKTVPPELIGQIPKGYELYKGDRISMKDIRNWRKGLSVHVGPFILSTALDDLLAMESPFALYSMLDYKTKAKATNEADTQKYYGTQADCYDLALGANGYPTDGTARFAYYYPVIVPHGTTQGEDIGDGQKSVVMGWACQVIAIRADPERAKALVMAAGNCLLGNIPDAAKDCEYCGFINARTGPHPMLTA